MGSLHVLDHPMITHKLTLMRKKETGAKDFRQLLNEISMLMGYEITRDLPLEDVEIETPVSKMTAKIISGKKLAVVPILRAGLGMVDGILSLVPVAKGGHIGLYRDPETHTPVEYYCKLPSPIEERTIVVCDPMLATGGSSSAAIQFIKDRGGKRIKLIGEKARTDIERLLKKHVYLELFVRVEKDWRNNDDLLKTYGYKQEKN